MNIMENTILLFLVFARVSGIFLLTPIFGSTNIPKRLKIGLAGFMTYIAFPLVSVSEAMNVVNIYQVLYFILIEFFIGLVFGFVSFLILTSINLAGIIIDRNIGFSMVNVINPQDQSHIPVTANFFYIIAMLVFLITNSHHILIKAVLHSFNVIPIGYESVNLLLVDKIIEILRTSFVLGFKMAAPIVITILATNVLLGVLARAMPQMNVFIVGMPLKIFIGLITIFIVLPLYFKIFNNIFEIMFEYIRDFINGSVRG
ncbi:flagellar biosynthetic protein FliR [Maledivibacter halophilus]|uniref:Flagellar biosynthetic protein FliR n=1 Tax=Maledivibacter halophilus TaxID=36842 RepID=A0A1T5LE36_9FIRM|nr:flagellar biosynthetic protein FliR [Maledivibacter halophilus]SKC74306.1 flagellar biosynthetic protein FliR [Maledivibacter halophilus]